MALWDQYCDDSDVDYEEAIALGSLAADCDRTGTFAVVYSDDSYADGLTRAEAESRMRDGARLFGPGLPATGLERCGQPTLCPDDLIVPCVLPAGHDGFCDGGR